MTPAFRYFFYVNYDLLAFSLLSFFYSPILESQHDWDLRVLGFWLKKRRLHPVHEENGCEMLHAISPGF